MHNHITVVLLDSLNRLRRAMRGPLAERTTELLNTTTELLNTTTELLDTTTELLNTTTELLNTTTELLAERTETIAELLLKTTTEPLDSKTPKLVVLINRLMDNLNPTLLFRDMLLLQRSCTSMKHQRRIHLHLLLQLPLHTDKEALDNKRAFKENLDNLDNLDKTIRTKLLHNLRTADPLEDPDVTRSLHRAHLIKKLILLCPSTL